MAKQLDPRLVDILKQYHPDPRSAIWDCHGTWVIYHKAIEVIAAKAGVTFDQPQIIVADQEKKNVAILVTGHMGDRSEWSIGEAAPYNNKNSYPFAMAEKRAKDRAVLKLVGLHGEVYSEEEADAFQNKPNNSNPEPQPVPANPNLKTDLIKEIGAITDPELLKTWGEDNAERMVGLTAPDLIVVRQNYSAKMKSLKAAA